MNSIGKYSILRVASLLMLCCVVLSCGDKDDSGEPRVENSIEGSAGVGIKRLDVKFPAISKLVVVSQSDDSVIIELNGVDDLQTYNLYATVEHSDGVVSIKSSDEALADLPHQEYYVNFIKFPSDGEDVKSAVSDKRSVILGAKISIADPNNIVLTSSYNEERDCFGSGTESDPISVVTVKCIEEQILEELTGANVLQHLKDVHFRQTRDINFALEYEVFKGWTAAGKYNIYGHDIAFCGVYDGGRNSISDLMISTNSSAALFYELGDGAVIKNVKMSGLDIKGGYYAGAIACKASGDVTIQNVDVSGNVVGHGSVGGMIGEGNAKFIDCYSQMNISDNKLYENDDVEYAMGGFIGHVTGDTSFDVCAYSGYITNSFGSYCCGGYVGSTVAADCHLAFVNCAVKGAVGSDESSVTYAGGLIGYCGDDVNILVDNVVVGSQFKMLGSDDDSDSIFGDNPEVATADLRIISDGDTGGFIGRLEGQSKVLFSGNGTYVSRDCSIDGCDSTGGVIGCSVGKDGGLLDIMVLDRVYSNATVDSEDGESAKYVGGFVGYAEYTSFTCSNSTIINDPVSMPESGYTAIGSFAGYYYNNECSSVNFVNYYEPVTEFMGSWSSLNSDLSSSTFSNMSH